MEKNQISATARIRTLILGSSSYPGSTDVSLNSLSSPCTAVPLDSWLPTACPVGYLTTLSVPRLYTVEREDYRWIMMNSKGFERKRSWHIRGTTPAFAWRLGKNTKNLSQESQCPGRDSNRASPEHKSRALPLDQPVRYLFINDLFNDAVISSVYSFGICILLCWLQMEILMTPSTIYNSIYLLFYTHLEKKTRWMLNSCVGGIGISISKKHHIIGWSIKLNGKNWKKTIMA
jgi:hypothetical protein